MWPVTSVAESGFPGYQASLWYPLVAPAATPAKVVRRLSTDVMRIMRSPAVGDQFIAQGVDPIGSSPEELAQFLRADIEKWQKVVPQMGIVAQ